MNRISELGKLGAFTNLSVQPGFVKAVINRVACFMSNAAQHETEEGEQSEEITACCRHSSDNATGHRRPHTSQTQVQVGWLRRTGGEC